MRGRQGLECEGGVWWACPNQCQEMRRRVDALGRAAIRDVIFRAMMLSQQAVKRRVLRTVVSASWGCKLPDHIVSQVTALHRLLAVWRVVIVAAAHRLHLEIKEERARAAGQGSGSPVSDGAYVTIKGLWQANRWANRRDACVRSQRL